jgi:hypothetical protein
MPAKMAPLLSWNSLMQGDEGACSSSSSSSSSSSNYQIKWALSVLIIL